MPFHAGRVRAGSPSLVCCGLSVTLPTRLPLVRFRLTHATDRASRIATSSILQTRQRHQPMEKVQCVCYLIPETSSTFPFSKDGQFPHYLFFGFCLAFTGIPTCQLRPSTLGASVCIVASVSRFGCWPPWRPVCRLGFRTQRLIALSQVGPHSVSGGG